MSTVDSSTTSYCKETGASRNNLIVTLAVLGLIVALFFIPEIIGMQTSGRGTAPEPSDEELPQSESAQSENSFLLTSPLEKLLLETEARASLGHTSDGAISKEQLEADRDVYFPNGPGTSWEDLRGKDIRKALTSTTRTVRGMLNDIPMGYGQTRQALFIYSSAVHQLLRSGKRYIAPAEVVPILDQLDRNVTNAMLREGVERGVFMRWRDISLGPVLDDSVSFRLKQQITIPYRPNFGIESVRIFQAATNHGKRNPEANMRMRLRVYVQGSDTERIEFYRNGELMFSRPIKKKGDRAGRRRFILPSDPDIRGAVYTLRVIDQYGSVAEKHYSFDRTIHRFQWTRTYGLFSIPFPEFDPRIDRAFRIGAAYTANSGATESAIALSTF